ncbi:MAG: hypothetical protein QGH33_06950, partial [Pirellulaceae bacterium]|nr:hypothetical protein [Pirellulaceae bacterium]
RISKRIATLTEDHQKSRLIVKDVYTPKQGHALFDNFAAELPEQGRRDDLVEQRGSEYISREIPLRCLFPRAKD